MVCSTALTITRITTLKKVRSVAQSAEPLSAAWPAVPIGAVIGAVAGGIASGAGVAAVDKVDNDNTVTGVGHGVTPKAWRSRWSWTTDDPIVVDRRTL